MPESSKLTEEELHTRQLTRARQLLNEAWHIIDEMLSDEDQDVQSRLLLGKLDGKIPEVLALDISCLCLHESGLTYKEIGRRFGFNAQRAQQRVQRLKPWLSPNVAAYLMLLAMVTQKGSKVS